MSFRRFLFDKTGILIVQAASAVVLGLYLSACSVALPVILLIYGCWLLILAAVLFTGYEHLRRKIEALERNLSRIDQKYLICELLDKPETALEEAYNRTLRTACKSMAEEVSAQRSISRSYKEYMEEWVHEVKTPITAIDLICANHPFPESGRIGRELSQIRYLVEQVLYYARSEQVEKDYFIQKLRICDAIQPALLQCRTLLLEAGISLQIDALEQTVLSDEKWLIFIFRQILLNSIQYRVKNNPQIRIYSQSMSDSVRLIFEDNGIGIAPSDLPRIFDKGFTGRNRTHQKATGLGLYLCRRLCLRLGIGIGAQSSPGKTCIYLDFPISSMTGALTDL